MDLTQWREGAKGAKMRLLRCYCRFYPIIPDLYPAIPARFPVIPAKAGIQRVAAKSAIRNQVQIAVSGSPLPLWERARVRVTRASALRARRPRSQIAKPAPCKPPAIPAKAGIQTVAIRLATRNQVQIAISGSLLPSWEKVRMRAPPRASAAPPARRPRSQGAKPTPISP